MFVGEGVGSRLLLNFFDTNGLANAHSIMCDAFLIGFGHTGFEFYLLVVRVFDATHRQGTINCFNKLFVNWPCMQRSPFVYHGRDKTRVRSNFAPVLMNVLYRA